MAKTTIRVPQELKERVARAAKHAGKSQIRFILEAISEKAEFEEQRVDFVETAERRYDTVVASGKTIPWSEMRQYLERRAAGEVVTRPKARRPAQ